jgi:hypothetical protein
MYSVSQLVGILSSCLVYVIMALEAGRYPEAFLRVLACAVKLAKYEQVVPLFDLAATFMSTQSHLLSAVKCLPLVIDVVSTSLFCVFNTKFPPFVGQLRIVVNELAYSWLGWWHEYKEVELGVRVVGMFVQMCCKTGHRVCVFDILCYVVSSYMNPRAMILRCFPVIFKMPVVVRVINCMNTTTKKANQ